MIRIMQYCDGLLSPAEAAKVAAEIAHDPEAAELASELAAGAAAAQSAWAELENGPVPLALARRVSEAAARQPSLVARKADWRVAATLLLGLALGALGAMMIERGGAPGLRLAGLETAPNAADAWKPAAIAALRQDPALAQVTFGDAQQDKVTIQRWFDTATRLHCAEFLISMAGAADTSGIACHKPDGAWDVIAQDR